MVGTYSTKKEADAFAKSRIMGFKALAEMDPSRGIAMQNAIKSVKIRKAKRPH
jgi:hypothetical protein